MRQKKYHGEGPNSGVDDEICHVTNQVSCEANIEQHVEHVENLFSCVNSMQVSITDCCESHNRPVHGIGVSQPNTSLFEIGNLTPYPRVSGCFVVCG